VPITLSSEGALEDIRRRVTLRAWDEAIGIFGGLFVEDENIVLTLKVDGQQLDIPLPEAYDNSILAKIAVGNRIGILKTDLPTKLFVLRKIEERLRAPQRDR
jgi:hypothetical protein